MTAPASTSRHLARDWGEDVIYSEAVCNVDDVYYEGSMDDDSDQEARKLRIEAVGRRYLDGHVPFLLSASLRGPFDKDSGWVNPWGSKPSDANPIPASHKSSSKRALPSIYEETTRPQRGLISDSLECHLPSPESLKQATVTDAHPYLEDDELAIVQSWRTSIYVPSLSQDSFWAPTKTQLAATAKKRRVKESEWLKKVANKRRKPDSSDPSFSKSPLVQRSNSNSRGSPRQNTVRFFESSQGSKSRVRRLGTEDGEDDQSQEDELMTSTPNASFGSAHGPLASTPKRVSPRRDMWKPAVLNPVDSEDELSQKEAAAAMLSSPVSQRRQGQLACIPHPKVAMPDPTAAPTASVKTQSSTADDKQLRNLVESSHMVPAMNDDELQDETMSKGGISTPAADFETQQDESFLFRKRSKSKDPETKFDGTLPGESDQPKEIVPPGFASSPNCASVEQSSGPIVVDLPGIIDTMEDVQGDMAGSRDVEEVEQNEATAKADSQSTAQQSTIDQETHERLGCDHDTATQDSASSNVSKETNQQARPPPPPPPQLAQDNIMPTAEAAADLYASSTSPGDISQEVGHQIPDPAPETNCERGVHHVMVPADAVATPEVESAAPVAAKQGSHVSSSQSLTNELSTAPAAEEIESFASQARLDKPACPEDNDSDDAPVEKSADRDATEFSFKNILHRLVPSSPWTKLSQLTARSTSSPAPAAKLEEPTDEDLIDTCCDFESRVDPNGQDAVSPGLKQASMNEQNDFTTAGSTMDALPCQSTAESNSAAVLSGLGPPVDIVPEETQGRNDISDSQMASSNIRITESQQSPWMRTQTSQQMVLPTSDVPIPTVQVSQPEDVRSREESQCAIPPEAQSPWSGRALMAADAAAEPAMALFGAGGNVNEDGQAHAGEMSRPEPRPSTPEPRFAFKSFASFMSPSPERTQRQRIRPRSQGRLPSAIRDPWSGSRTNRRVSWASMSSNQDDESRAQNPEGWKPKTPTSRSMSRQGSPPPTTPIGDLPISEDAKFNKHFAAVASRTDGLRQKLIPTASQQVAQSPGLYGMAETFMAADTTDACKRVEEPVIDCDAAHVDSQEPMDVVDDMFREMGDFLQVWDVDVELNRARKATSCDAQQVGIASQSPW